MRICRRSSRRGVAASAAAAAAASVACALLAARAVQADDTLNADVEDAFAFAGIQLQVLADDVLTEEGVFTDYTGTDGNWVTEKSDGDTLDMTVWTSGMVAGMYWYQYEATGVESWKTAATFFTEGLEGVEELDDNDLGFQVLNSFGLGYRLSSDTSEQEAYAARVLTGAQSLYDFKWASDIPAFWSWSEPSQRPEWELAVNVDMIMNMEIMLWASVNGGSTDFADAVAAHADTTWEDIVRDDNSTFHVADYDPDTGDLVDQGTYQGWEDSSTWSRGQAWGIYGYAMIYRYLQEDKFLSRSLGLLEYWEDNLPVDLVPPADFDAPESASDNGKDSSATAVVASALFELFLITEDVAYLVKAQSYLNALLSADYYLPEATDGWQSILRRATAKWGEPEVGAVFGDYFLLEALVRYKRLAPSILLWEEAEVEISATAAAAGDDDDGATSSGVESRRMQVLSGGEFCALKVSGSTVEFEDEDCTPVAPDFTTLEVGNTPSPSAAGNDDDATIAPTTASRGGGEAEEATLSPAAAPSATLAPIATATEAPVKEITPSPVEVAGGTTSPADPPSSTATPESTPTPVDVLSPTAAPGSTPSPVGTLSPSGAAPVSTLLPIAAPITQAPSAGDSGGQPTADTGSMVFGTAALSNDVALTYLDSSSSVLVWLSVTLNNIANTPSSLLLENGSGDVVETTITAPADGWTAGDNKASFSLPTIASWEGVAGVTIVFDLSETATTGDTTTATVNWLVVSNELVL